MQTPFTFCPLPRWLQTWDHDGEEEKFGYPIPSEATIREQSAVLNLWGRQWSSGLANEIQSIALGILEERISGFACGSRAPFASIDPYCLARSVVKCCMPKLVETFCAFVPASITHKTVGDALMLVGVVGDRDVMKVLGGKPAHRTCVLLFMAILPKYLTESCVPRCDVILEVATRAIGDVSCLAASVDIAKELAAARAAANVATWATPCLLLEPGLPMFTQAANLSMMKRSSKQAKQGLTKHAFNKERHPRLGKHSVA